MRPPPTLFALRLSPSVPTQQRFAKLLGAEHASSGAMRAIQRFGQQLQRLRNNRGLTQEQLAVKAGLARVYVVKLEQGGHDPALSTLVRLAKVLRSSVPELLGESLSPIDWWQVGASRFPTRAEAEDHARTVGELFVARHQQNKAGDVARRIFPVRGT